LHGAFEKLEIIEFQNSDPEHQDRELGLARTPGFSL
jgi:hypothetical protein